MPAIKDISELKKISLEIRKDVIKSLSEAGSGHLGGSLGLADVFTCLYFSILNHNPQSPDWENRDRLILSIGHVAPVFYASLAHAGYFKKEELLTLRKFGSRLQGHPGKEHGLPGIELSSGSLGQGLSVAVGLALAAKIDNKNWRVFSIHGDGEMQEGSIWEAAMSASHYKLDNLIALVDRNSLQIDGKTSDVMEIEPLSNKFESFGWNVLHCDGHDHKNIIESYEKAFQLKNKPTVIIAKTIMGKGVKSVENEFSWHGKAPSTKQAEEFLLELNDSYYNKK
ncbi:MAG: transketolase [Bacteroidetes bacterium GWF2_33_16]|nr:MAG: transketolase [Bacteroidetes bacterium GWE2_32_14]OFY03838.1 MAG: transketolase [Bacteroidetes bacterium GWF2_33_16]